MARRQRPGSNPVLDLLERTAFSELAAALRSQAERIMEDWEAMVREVLPAADRLTFTQLRDHLPETLDRLAAALECRRPDETRQLIWQTAEHGLTRFQDGYNIDELLVEYQLLRRVLIERVEAAMGRRTTTAEDLALSTGMDTIVHQGVVAFVNHQSDRLRSAARTEAKYLSFLSHDLRNSLNGAVLVMELLRRRLAETDGFAEEVSDLDHAKRSIMQTIDGMHRLLEAERAGQAAVGRKREAVDLARLASDASAAFERQAREKGLSLAVAVPPDAVAQSDRELLGLILQNLIGNAVKYSSSGTVRVEGERSVACENAWALAVRDERPGIAPDKLARVYDAFVRGDTHGQAGVGLGLAIAARALGATLSAQSELGVGTTF